MTKKYNEEFKKQLGNEYLNDTSYPSLEKAYGVAKLTISGWVKKYSKKVAVFFAKEIDEWCIDLLIIIRSYLGFGGCLGNFHYPPISIITILKIQSLSIKNNSSGFMRK